MLSKRCFFLTKKIYSLHQSANIRIPTVPCQSMRFSDHSKRFTAVNLSNDPKMDEDVDRKLKFVKLEMAYLRDTGRRMPNPDLIRKCDWNELLKYETQSARKKYYDRLFAKEEQRKNSKIKKQEKKNSFLALKEQQQQQQQGTNPHITYSLSKTAMMLRISNKTMDNWRNNRLRQAMQFGEKLIFDCSFDQHMTLLESSETAAQLQKCFSINRKHREPFDLHFCNVNFNAETFNIMKRRNSQLLSQKCLINLHEGSYLDMFPKEKLVYLTQHCRNDLTDFDPDSIYIVGAAVNKKNQESWSLMIARELNLKVARLPLYRLDWGSKLLSLDDTMKLMLGIKSTRNWDALKLLLGRKIRNEELNERK